MADVNVMLADDHNILRKGLCSLLSNEPGVQIVAEAEDGREALTKVGQLRPDVVLMDISMPGLNGLEATRQMCRQFPEVKVLILSMYATEEYIFQALRAGASGYLVKNAGVTELVTAIRAVEQGESYLSPSISRTVISEYIQRVEADLEEDSYSTLTAREREVLQLIAEGHSTREIAQLLVISEKTVRAHRTSVREKLDMKGTAELTQYAMRKGLIARGSMMIRTGTGGEG